MSHSKGARERRTIAVAKPKDKQVIRELKDQEERGRAWPYDLTLIAGILKGSRRTPPRCAFKSTQLASNQNPVCPTILPTVMPYSTQTDITGKATRIMIDYTEIALYSQWGHKVTFGVIGAGSGSFANLDGILSFNTWKSFLGRKLSVDVKAANRKWTVIFKDGDYPIAQYDGHGDTDLRFSGSGDATWQY